MLNKTILLFFCFLQISPQCLRSQTVDADSLSDPAFDNLRYTFLAQQTTGDSITIILLVQDKDGNFVKDMAKPKKQHEYFSALIGKDEKEICKDFTVTESMMDQGPIRFNFSLVLNYPDSMKAMYPTMQSAAQRFIYGFPNAYFSRFNFDACVDPVVSLPIRDRTPIKFDILSTCGHGTALIAAAHQGVESLRNTLGVRMVILFTYGNDNASGYASGCAMEAPYLCELVKNARKQGASIYALGFDIDKPSPIDSICRLTNGQYFPVKNEEEISSAFNHLTNVFNQLRNTNFRYFYMISAKSKTVPYAIRVVQPNGTFKKHINILADQPCFSPKDSMGFGTILFDKGKSAINKGEDVILERITKCISKRLMDEESLKIEIQGHTSPEGDTNQQLSEDRATAVYNYILNIIRSKYPDRPDLLGRIKARGFGEKVNLHSETSPRNDENRRVEIWGMY